LSATVKGITHMKNRFFFSFVALLAAGFTATAATLKQDTQEFRVDGSFDPETYGGSEFKVGLTYGYVLQDNIEVGGRMYYEDNDDLSMFSLGGFGEYSFELESDAMPYVGLELSFISSDTGLENNGAVALAAYIGVRYFLTSDVAIGAQFRGTAATDDVFASDGGAESTDIAVIFGMSYFLPAN
jgi:opacity protein-like surface antigen